MSQVTSESTGEVWFAAFHQPDPMSLAKPFELALVEVTQVNAIVALDYPATATIATLESKQSDLQLIPPPLTLSNLTQYCIFHTSLTSAAAASRERLVAT
jgi:hypothetical protein